MSWDGQNSGWPMDEPIGWVVIRRRGGWNAEPAVVAFYHQEWQAQFEALTPELSGFEPPADCTDLFTYHAVMPPRWPVTLPTEVKSLDEIGPRKRLLDGPLFRGVRVGRVWFVDAEPPADE